MNLTKIIKIMSGIILLGVFLVSIDPVTTDASSNGAGDSIDSYQKTDIAQIFITTDNEINRNDYSEATIAIVDSENGSNETIIDNAAVIKVRGNSTAGLKKKPYNFKLSSSKSVLGMSKGKKWCLLANFLDTSLMRNKLAYDFAKSIGLSYCSESRFVDVWLNGCYAGNYLLAEPIEVGENRIDINTDKNEYLLELDMGRVEEGVNYMNTYIFRFILEAPEEITKEQESWLFNFLISSEAALKSGNYNQVTDYFDINSFIDFYIVEELFKNKDVNLSSTRFYIKDDKIFAGPIWDFDLSAGNVSEYEGYQECLIYNNKSDEMGSSFQGFWSFYKDPAVEEYDTWIGLLMRYDSFRVAFNDRFTILQDQIVNLYLDNSLGTNQIDVLQNKYSNSFTRDYGIWPLNKNRGSELYRTNEKTYADSVEYLRNWLKDRNQWLLDMLRIKQYKVFFLANGGAVSIKSKVISNQCYYGILPEAKRKKHKFIGWYTEATGGVRVTMNNIVTLTGSQKLYAHWEKLMSE